LADTVSALVDTLLFQIRATKLPAPTLEYRFARNLKPPRQWRFDLCYQERMLAIEVEGGSWIGGRHTRGSGFEEDCEKYNEAAITGWSVLRVTGDMIASGKALGFIERALAKEVDRG
jgi:hypothetical protein